MICNIDVVIIGHNDHVTTHNIDELLFCQWKQRVQSSNLVRIINLHVRFSTYSLVLHCFSCILQVEKFVKDFCHTSCMVNLMYVDVAV